MSGTTLDAINAQLTAAIYVAAGLGRRPGDPRRTARR